MYEMPQKLEDIPPDLVSKLRAALLATDSSDTPLYTEAQIEDLAVEMLLDGLAAAPDVKLPPPAMALLERFVARVGISAREAEGQTLVKARQYLRDYPPPAALKNVLTQVVREHLQAGDDGASRQQKAQAMLNAATDLASSQRLDALAPSAPTGVGKKK